MRTLYLLVTSLILSSCSFYTSQKSPDTKVDKVSQVSSKKNVISKKNPMNVSFYSEGKLPAQVYTILGQEVISKFNPGGIKRQTAIIHDKMRTLAADLGGDAVINIKRDNKSISGTVIAFKG